MLSTTQIQNTTQKNKTNKTNNNLLIVNNNINKFIVFLI